MSIVQWLFESLGFPQSVDLLFIYYVIAGVILLVILDGILSFFISGITGLTTRGRK